MAKRPLSFAQIFRQSTEVLGCLKANSTKSQHSSIQFHLIIFSVCNRKEKSSNNSEKHFPVETLHVQLNRVR